ncbi:hypothetical protein HMI55_007328 [Coelomomyces lativittatus]|nr:hypothetical protein HMI56_005437 [Coelomomyces lativittatus]KAJ1509601.1 hypothetical protein HMI55_007327 [Coelomomyces lativittatus]KAJ1509602.1 hypothetical protein HMI55_007328 [Coelomomyces lativittatus]
MKMSHIITTFLKSITYSSTIKQKVLFGAGTEEQAAAAAAKFKYVINHLCSLVVVN